MNVNSFLKIYFIGLLLLFLFPVSTRAEESGEQVDNYHEYRIKVLSLNIHSAVNWYGQYDLESLVDFIQEVNPDIIGLQEVDRLWSYRSRFQDICLELANRLNMNYAFSVSLGKREGYFGNQILSKFPMTYIWSEKLPSLLEVRSFVFAQLWINGIRVNVLNTHLGLSEADRIQQVSEIQRFINQVNGPIIIMGDFNGESSDQGIDILKRNFVDLQDVSEYKNLGTFRLKNGNLGSRIDYILTTPDFLCQSFRVYENYISDHLPLVAEVSLFVNFDQIAGEPFFQQSPL